MSLKTNTTVLFSEESRWISLPILIVMLELPALFAQPASIIHWTFVVAVAVIVPPLCRAAYDIRVRSLNQVFFLILAIYALAHLAYELLVYYTGMRATTDTAAFVQSFWNLLHNGRFLTTIDGQYSDVAPEAISHFARHNSPILFIGYLFYWVFGSMVGLIVLNTLALVVTGVLAYRLILLAFPSGNGRVLLAFLPFVLLLQVPFFLMRDFYETLFFPPLLVWLGLSYKREDRIQFALASVFLASVKETGALALIAWAVVALFARKKSYAAIALSVAALSLVISFGFTFPATSPTESSPFPAEIAASLSGLNTADLIAYWTQLLAGWAGLPIFSLIALVAGPEVFLNSLFSGTIPWTLEIIGRYQLLVHSALFLATIDALPRVARMCESRLQIKDPMKYLVTGIMTVAVCSLFLAGPRIHALLIHLSGDWKADTECISTVANAEGAVIAEHTIGGYFCERPLLWSEGLPLPPGTWERADWVVGKRRSKVPFTAIGEWDTVCTSANLFVLKKRNAAFMVPQ